MRRVNKILSFLLATTLILGAGFSVPAHADTKPMLKPKVVVTKISNKIKTVQAKIAVNKAAKQARARQNLQKVISKIKSKKK